MKIKVEHKKTGKQVKVESDGTTLSVTGDKDLKNGVNEYFGTFSHTLGMKNVKNEAYHTFGEHLIKSNPSGIESVDTASFEFLKKFFIPAISKMGTECTIIEDE